MISIGEIAREIVAREGGFVDDPDDPGGVTKYGVTLKTLRGLGIDTTQDGTVDLADLKALTRAQAEQIFVEHYFHAPGIDLLPGGLQASVFDMYVNAGANAVKILQAMLREMGFDIAVDGVIGPNTVTAALQASQHDPIGVRDAYGVARRNYYFRLADRRKASRKYVRTRAGGKGGWIKRAEAFLSARYHMDQRSFNQRVAGWQ